MDAAEILIDTSVVIDHLRKRDKRKSILFAVPETTTIFISAITFFELQAGANDAIKRHDIELVLKRIAVLPFDNTSASEAGKLYRELRSANALIEIRDLFIAATACANDLPLLTLNTKHFERVEGLHLLRR